jgi:hypothetical protein
MKAVYLILFGAVACITSGAAADDIDELRVKNFGLFSPRADVDYMNEPVTNLYVPEITWLPNERLEVSLSLWREAAKKIKKFVKSGKLDNCDQIIDNIINKKKYSIITKYQISQFVDDNKLDFIFKKCPNIGWGIGPFMADSGNFYRSTLGFRVYVNELSNEVMIQGYGGIHIKPEIITSKLVELKRNDWAAFSKKEVYQKEIYKIKYNFHRVKLKDGTFFSPSYGTSLINLKSCKSAELSEYGELPFLTNGGSMNEISDVIPVTVNLNQYLLYVSYSKSENGFISYKIRKIWNAMKEDSTVYCRGYYNSGVGAP